MAIPDILIPEVPVRRAVLLLPFLATGLMAIAPAVALTQDTPAVPTPIASLLPQIDSIVRRYMEDAHIPGLALPACDVELPALLLGSSGSSRTSEPVPLRAGAPSPISASRTHPLTNESP